MTKTYSILDAFRALDDIEAEQQKAAQAESETNQTASSINENLNEGRSFDLMDPKEVELAKEFVEDNAKAENTQLEVVDVDADSVEHLKEKEDYLGQYILKCRACATLRYVDADHLQTDESDPTMFVTEDACPHCHAEDSGYDLIGQVGKVEEEEEVSVDEMPLLRIVIDFKRCEKACKDYVEKR